MTTPLSNRRVAILATDGVEQVEYTRPRRALEAAGARVDLVSPHEGHIQGFHRLEHNDRLPVDITVDEADPDSYDALFVPGGVANGDLLRADPRAVRFTRAFFDAGKPVASICHGPWVLVEAGVLPGRTITSWPSLRTDVRNAGGEWVDEEVHTDNGLVTSRRPGDLPAFNARMVEEFSQRTHAVQAVGAPAP